MGLWMGWIVLKDTILFSLRFFFWQVYFSASAFAAASSAGFGGF
jgi:hypothetical protein